MAWPRAGRNGSHNSEKASSNSLSLASVFFPGDFCFCFTPKWKECGTNLLSLSQNFWSPEMHEQTKGKSAAVQCAVNLFTAKGEFY